jgi:hypothetical protein
MIIGFLLWFYVQYVHYVRKLRTDDYLERIPVPKTAFEAQPIVHKFFYVNFALLATKGSGFGLFKTYCIPSIYPACWSKRESWSIVVPDDTMMRTCYFGN